MLTNFVVGFVDVGFVYVVCVDVGVCVSVCACVRVCVFSLNCT